jgi:hypothetical protein
VSAYRINKDKDNPYLMINKQCLDDVTLSLKAKGMLTYLLSLPDDWQIYEDEIVRHHKDGKDSIKSAIKELITSGYIIRERKRDDLGRLRAYNYNVYEISQKPCNNAVSVHSGLSNVGKSATTNIHCTNNEHIKQLKKDKLTKQEIISKATYDFARINYLKEQVVKQIAHN